LNQQVLFRKEDVMSDSRDIEVKTFKAAKDDGLWDVMLASAVAMFAVAPLLSELLGDFWSSAVFLPVWLVIYVAIRQVREHVLKPRVGTIEIGEERRRSLSRASMILLVVNIVAFVGGTVAWFGFGSDWFDIDGLVYPFSLGLVALIGGTAVAYFTHIGRFAVYGLILAAAPIVGEWLWQNGYADHHGYPVVFGVAAVIILAAGLGRFISLLRSHPLPTEPGIV
jgi:hypothetical protein